METQQLIEFVDGLWNELMKLGPEHPILVGFGVVGIIILVILLVYAVADDDFFW